MVLNISMIHEWLQVMFDNRKEREELLEALVVDDKVFTIADFPQVCCLLIFQGHVTKLLYSKMTNMCSLG